jgi:peptide/nickel transport system substrate-binding protein
MWSTYRAVAVLAAVACALFAATVIGCGGDDDSSGDEVKLSGLQSGASTTGACASDPVNGGSLVYGRQSITENFNSLKIVNGNGDIFANNLVFNGLVRTDPKGSDKIEGAIADKWEIADDGMSYTFHIRPGIKFSNGQPVTAEDVKFSLDRFGDPKINQTLAAVAVGYKSSTIVDDENVRVDLTNPVPAFLYNISIFPGFIVPKDLLEQQGEDAFFKKPVGTGPFMVDELARGSHLTLVRNPNYWEEGKPYLDKVRFDFATDSNSRLLALKDGQVQIIDGVPFSQVNSLKNSGDLIVQSAKVPYFVGLWFNHKREPLADVNVRQAMQYALNRKEINASIYRNVGTIPNSVLMQLKYDAPASEVEPYPYDVEKAKEAIGKSEFPDGFPISLKYPAGYDYFKQLALYLQNAWSQIGVKVKLIEADQSSLTDSFYKGDYDLAFPYAQFTSDLPVPDEYAQFVAEPKSGLNGFFSSWKDPEITKMVRKFVSNPSEDERAQEWPEIQRALNEQTPWINVMDLPFLNAHATNVCGTDIDALGSDHLENTWIAKG